MTGHRKEALFLIRAYNDMDIQLPLIAAFGEDQRFTVRVVGYPCDGTMGNPARHEGAAYLRKALSVRIETVLDSPDAPLVLRALYKLEQYFDCLKKKSVAAPVFVSAPVKAIHISLLRLMRKSFAGSLPWLDKVAHSWDPAFIVMDEVLGQRGRSAMMDRIVRDKTAAGVPVYMVQTGHLIYRDPAPNKAENATLRIEDVSYFKTPARHFIVPGMLDKEAVSLFFRDENISVLGNVRMDRGWIEKLHKNVLSPPYFDKYAFLKKLPQGSPRVVFMLSKLGYGIKLDEMKKTLRTVAGMAGVACAIKPHTRGMKFDFMAASELGDAAIVPDVPSSVLLEWADVVLFTGSSIAFHAMVLGKRAGFLQNCQYLETIFDDGVACDKFDTLEQLTAYLDYWREAGLPPPRNHNQNEIESWIKNYVYSGTGDGGTVMRYKQFIINDLQDT